MRLPILAGAAAAATLFFAGCSSTPPGSDAAGIASRSAASPADARPGLGTKYGETCQSRVRNVDFQRATPTRPLTLATVQYNDVEGARAMGWIGWNRGPVALSDLADAGFQDQNHKYLPLDTRSGLFAGKKYGLVGKAGGRYSILLTNQSDSRLEFVASVDGVDVIDGKPASLNKSGYVVPPGQSVRIDGFRRSLNEVAAFRFSAVRESYAEKKYGDAANVGVIGIAVFAEAGTDPKPRLKEEAKRRKKANPFPGERRGGFAEPPPR